MKIKVKGKDIKRGDKVTLHDGTLARVVKANTFGMVRGKLMLDLPNNEWTHVYPNDEIEVERTHA